MRERDTRADAQAAGDSEQGEKVPTPPPGQMRAAGGNDGAARPAFPHADETEKPTVAAGRGTWSHAVDTLSSNLAVAEEEGHAVDGDDAFEKELAAFAAFCSKPPPSGRWWWRRWR